MRRILLSLLVLLAFVGAACGGGDDDTDVSSDTTNAAAAQEEDGDAGSDEEFTGKGSGDFCEKARKLTEEFEEREEAESPEQMESFFDDVIKAIEDLEDEAPSEIKADLTKSLESFKKSRDVFEKYDYDFEKIAAAPEAKELENPEAEAANERVDKYFEDVCKIDDGDDSTDDTTDTTAE